MTSISSISAYGSAPIVQPVRVNSDYEAAKGTRASGHERHHDTSTFGPATNVTLSPEAQAVLQANKAKPEKAAAPTDTSSSPDQNAVPAKKPAVPGYGQTAA